MMNRILVAVDDSAPSLAAAAYAVALAADRDAQLNFVTVSEGGLGTVGILRHVARLAADAGVVARTTAIEGNRPYDVLLARATEWDADLIVMGRSDLRRPGQPYVGSQTEHLLEFTTIPVVVVPHPNEVAL